ncbi:radical SAM protein [archaeon]|jgi:MoaA/NifB/PqqE/SkfB family radical SAM enzyme|nr:radical SAM protein [archaeon]MBT4241461.1 radical SAM protein [archaeon]MBT4417668.1 radical SAM protein [archaeon]
MLQTTLPIIENISPKLIHNLGFDSKVQKDIELKLRREHIPNGVRNRPADFWLLYDSDINHDRLIADVNSVARLDSIFQENSHPQERDEEIVDYLMMSGVICDEKRLKSYWLPPVEDALSSPVKFFFNPSGKCPNKCLTCFADELSSATLEDKVAREALDQILNLPFFWLNLGGCELSFYPLYFEFAEKAIKSGVHASTAISGVGLKREWAERVRDLGVKVKVSLDGPKRINDIQRPETYEPAIEAIRMFRDIGYPVKMNLVHSRYNNDERVIDEMFDIALANGASGIDISICRPKGGALENDLMIPYEDFESGKVKSVLDRFLNHPYIKRHGIKAWVNKSYRKLDYLDAKPCQALNTHCNAGRYSMGVNNNGLIDACIFIPDELIPTANVNNPEFLRNPNFLLDVWQNNPIFKKVREASKGKLCGSCEDKGIEMVRGCLALEDYYKQGNPLHFLH